MQIKVTSGDVTGAATKTLVSILSTATRRPKILQIIVACTGAPADATAKFVLKRMTADGTGTANTNVTAVDAGTDGAPTLTSKTNYTVEPTYVANEGSDIGLNQRVTAIWNPPFGGVYGCPIGAGAGFGLQMISGPALAYDVTMFVDE